MKGILFFLMAIVGIDSNAISASLKIVQYEPTVFQLQFSQSISLPEFQLILNNAETLNYTLLTTTSPSATFYFQTDPYSPPSGQILENYQLMFNSPLGIGLGRLSTQYFRLTASKQDLEISQLQIWGILLVIAGYLLINFAFFGMILIEFLQVYCLMSFRASMHTTLYQQISNGLLLLNPNLDEAYNQPLYAKMCIPPLIILLVGSVCFLIKRFVKDKSSIIKKLSYETLVYDFFLSVSLVFVMPSFFNSIQFLNLVAEGNAKIDSTINKIGSLFSYLGIVTSLFLVYLYFYIINPKVKESEASWQKYLKSSAYMSFRRLHEMVKWDSWHSRNKNIMMVLKRLLIACLCFSSTGFQSAIFLLEFLNIIYVFIMQPYKEEAYMNIVAVCRLLMLIYYGIVVVGNLYYSMGPVMMNYSSSIKPFVLASDTVFLIVCLSIVLATIYQIYIKCANFNYQVKLVREENQIKLKIVQRRITSDIESQDKKNQNEISELDYERQKQTSHSPELRRRDPTLLRRPTKLRKLSETKKKRNYLADERDLTNKILSKQGANMVEVSQKNERSVSLESRESKSKRDKIRWKKESLLVQIMREKE